MLIFFNEAAENIIISDFETALSLSGHMSRKWICIVTQKEVLKKMKSLEMKYSHTF